MDSREIQEVIKWNDRLKSIELGEAIHVEFAGIVRAKANLQQEKSAVMAALV